MKKILLISALILLTVTSFSQDNKSELPRVAEDTLFTTSGYNIVDGQDVKLGTGSLPNGDFKYITVSSASWLTAGAGRQEPVGRKWNGHLFKVKKFRKEGNRRRGFTYYLVLGGGNIVNYECDIESAIASGEIVVPEEFRPKQKAVVVEVKQPISIADEIAKLKKLYDDGILTKEEFEAQKKKLLEQKQ